MYVFFGALAVGAQFRTTDNLQLFSGNQPLTISPGSHLALPALLLGLLVIFIIDGITQARSTTLGLVLVALLTGFFQAGEILFQGTTWASIRMIDEPVWAIVRAPLVSLIALVADFVVLWVVYRAVSSLGVHLPQWLAGGVALLAALWSDSLLHLALSGQGIFENPNHLPSIFLGNLLVAVLLSPLLALYLRSRVIGISDEFASAIPDLEAGQRQVMLYAAVETMLDGLLITNVEGEILYANPAVARIADVDRENLVGKHLQAFFPAETTGRDMQACIRALLEHGRLTAEFEIPAQDGLAAFVAMRGSLVRDAEDQISQLIFDVHDITSLRRYESRLLTLNQQIIELVQIYDTQDLLRAFLKSSGDLLRAWASAVFLVAPDGKTITHFITHGLPEGYSQRIAQDYKGLLGETAALSSKPVCVEDVLKGPVYADQFHDLVEYGVRALSILPVLFQEQILGALVVYYDQPREFNEDELQLGLTLAHSLAIAIQNANLYRAEQSQRQLTEALARAAASLNSSLNLELVLDQILEQTLRVAAGNSTNIMMVEGDSVRVVRRGGSRDLPESTRLSEERRYPLIFPTLQHMIRTGEPILIADTAHDPRWTWTEESAWIKSHAGAPLKVEGRIVGFLNVDSNQAGYFTGETTQRLQALADHAAIAIHNAQLYEESRRRAEERSMLIRAAEAVSSSLDFNQVLSVIAQQIAKLVDVEGCAISDYDPISNTITLLANYYFEPLEITPDWFRSYDLKDYPVTLQVLEQGELVQLRLQEPGLDAAERAIMEKGDVETLLMMPLKFREQTIGLVEVESNDPDRVFTPHELVLLQTLCSHAANAIQNARLYSQLQRYTAELEDRVQERTADLQAAKERIEGILASVPDAVFVLNEQGKAIHSNQAGEALLSRSREQELDLFAPEFLSDLKDGKLSAEKTILEVQGRAYQALTSTLALDKHQGGLVVVFRDVTRFRELDQMKTQFVSDVSHELRTPLTNLMLYLDLLSASEDATLNNRYLGTLQRETKRLGHLIEDLLTISRLEAGRVEVKLDPVDVNRLLSELVQDRSALAISLERILRFEPNPDAPFAVADAGLLTQAISNLLTNALNYTMKGGTVTLSVGVVNEAGASWVAVNVADDGVGIAPEEIPHIFDRFYRGAASRQTGAPGTGLGLAICKEIADRMGGRIAVQSVPGEGSTFTFWLVAVL